MPALPAAAPPGQWRVRTCSPQTPRAAGCAAAGAPLPQQTARAPCCCEPGRHDPLRMQGARQGRAGRGRGRDCSEPTKAASSTYKPCMARAWHGVRACASPGTPVAGGSAGSMWMMRPTTPGAASSASASASRATPPEPAACVPGLPLWPRTAVSMLACASGPSACRPVGALFVWGADAAGAPLRGVVPPSSCIRRSLLCGCTLPAAALPSWPGS